MCDRPLKHTTVLTTQHVNAFSVFKHILHLSDAAIGSLQSKGIRVTPNNIMVMTISVTWNGRRKVRYMFTDVLQESDASV
jgi:hypothetical protein